MTEATPVSRLVRMRRPLLVAAGLAWLAVAAWGAWIYSTSSRDHATAIRALSWLDRSERLERQVLKFVIEASKAGDDPTAFYLPLLPTEALHEVTPDGISVSREFPELAVAPLEQRFHEEGARFWAELTTLAESPPEARTAALASLEQSMQRLLAALGELSDAVRAQLVEAEHALNVGGLALSLFALFSLVAVLLLMLLLRDSTRRERWLAESRAALSESERRFRASADGVPVVLVLTDTSGAITFTNAAWREFSGSADDSADRWRSLIHAEDIDRIAAERARARAAQEPYEFEFRIRRKDGAWRWWLSRGVPRRAADGRLLGYAALCLDITDRRAFEERQLESHRMEAMGRLAGGIAHDLNNILTVILGSTDLLFTDNADPAAFRENVAEIRSAAERAAQLVAQLLAFTRRQVVAPAAQDVAQVVREMVGLLRRLIGEDVELSIEAQPDARRVTIDPAQLTQIALNLVINARQAMPEGGKIGIEVGGLSLDAATARQRGLATGGEFVELSVRDDGTGMDAATREHVFEPFFTTKEGGRHVGLGLATVKTIVDENRGAVAIESAVGSGTTVRVLLRAAADSGERRAEAARRDPPASARAPATILLVEDDDAVRPLLRRYLERDGYRVVDAANGADAVEIARRESAIDLLVTDVVMPEVGGRRLAAAIAEEHPSVQVLYISGYTDDEVLRRGVSQDEQPFLQKPFTRDELLRRVGELLAARRGSGTLSAGDAASAGGR